MEQLHITYSDKEWSPKYFAIVSAMLCGMYMITLAISGKISDVWGFYLSASIITFPICCILTDVLTETYGFNRARQALWVTLVFAILFAIFTQLTILLPVAPFWEGQESFVSVFSTSWRITLAGCTALIVGELINSFIVSKLKIKQNAKSMSVRFIASTFIAQFFDSILFFSIAFAGTVSTPQLFNMIITAWLLKVAYEIIALPLSVSVTHKIKQLEGIEHFDRQKISVI